MALPYSFGRLWILSWFGFVPLFLALRGKTKKQSFRLAYLCGLVFWLATIFWLVNVTFIGTLVLAAYLALYFGVFGLFLPTGDRRPATGDYLIIPSVWVLLEYCRSHLFTGFPWALLGYSQCLNLPVIQIADLAGPYGVSFVVVMINYSIYALCAMRYASCVKTEKQRNKLFMLPVALLFISLGYGFYRLNITHSAQRTALKISLIQGNIPQELKWDTRNNDFIIARYLGLTSEAAKEKPDLVVWPEASLPAVLGQNDPYYELAAKLAKENNTELLLGAVTSKEGNYYNSALLISGQGGLVKQYDKIHLVPFGEYIPLKDKLPFLETIVPIGDIAAGKEYTVFKIASPPSGARNDARFAVLICFEDVFPELSRKFVREGANFLINITNDGWYNRTSAAFQHLQASVFRAVENNRFLARCANTGISAFIAPSGKILSTVRDKQGERIFIQGFASEEVSLPADSRGAFYTRYGDIFVLACLIFSFWGIIAQRKKA